MSLRVIIQFGAGSILLGLAVYGFLIEPAWVEVTYHRQPTKGLLITNYSWVRTVGPSSNSVPPRVRVVQVSDLHLHQFGRTEESVVEKLNALKPNLLLLTGDVADRPESLSVLADFLQRVKTKDKFAVLGNWEYWGNVDLQELKTIYSRHGVKLLVNECVEYSNEGFILHIAGLDDFTAGSPDERRIYEQCKDGADGKMSASTQIARRALILMQHSPGYFVGREPLERSYHWLTLSGHTHGGQVALFGYPIWTPPGSGPFVSGWYVTAFKDLYVSKGVGTSVVPFRFGSRPEIAVFDSD
jgi:predicted MPP superfamily phosphohydrolase